MPQQLVCTVDTLSPGIIPSTFSTAGIASNAFWWQCPCSRTSRFISFNRSLPGSRARYSSSRKLIADSASAGASLNSTAYSSRNERRQEGSSPMTGVPRSRCGRRASSVRRASARARSTMPAVRNVAAAAKRPSRSERPRSADRAPRGLEHPDRGAYVLRLEPAAEGIDEQHHLATRRLRLRGSILEKVGTPLRQWSLGAEAEKRSAQRCGPVGERRETTCPRRVARQVGDRTVAQRVAVARLVVRQELDLHARHVDTGRALALATLARHAEIERRLGRLLAFVAELAGDREAQRIGPSSSQVLFILRRAIGGAHRAGVEFAAVAVVVAHLDGLVLTAPFAPIKICI